MDLGHGRGTNQWDEVGGTNGMVPYSLNNGKKTVFDLAKSLSRTADQGQRCQCYVPTCWLQYSRAGYLPCLFPFQLIQGVAFYSTGSGESGETRPPTLENHIILHQLGFVFYGKMWVEFHKTIQQVTGKDLVANIQCKFLEWKDEIKDDSKFKRKRRVKKEMIGNKILLENTTQVHANHLQIHESFQ